MNSTNLASTYSAHNGTVATSENDQSTSSTTCTTKTYPALRSGRVHSIWFKKCNSQEAWNLQLSHGGQEHITRHWILILYAVPEIMKEHSRGRNYQASNLKKRNWRSCSRCRLWPIQEHISKRMGRAREVNWTTVPRRKQHPKALGQNPR